MNWLCAILLLAVLLPVLYLSGEWVEHSLSHLMRNPVWHEPLDDWNRL